MARTSAPGRDRTVETELFVSLPWAWVERPLPPPTQIPLQIFYRTAEITQVLTCAHETAEVSTFQTTQKLPSRCG